MICAFLHVKLYVQSYTRVYVPPMIVYCISILNSHRIYHTTAFVKPYKQYNLLIVRLYGVSPLLCTEVLDNSKLNCPIFDIYVLQCLSGLV
jgi:hypothetical protein